MSMSASRHSWMSLRRSSLPRQRWFIVILALLGGCALAMNTIVAGRVRDQIDTASARGSTTWSSTARLTPQLVSK